MRKFLLLFLLLSAIFQSKHSFGQAIGDYSSNGSGTWGTGYVWLKCVAAGTWAGATTTTTQPGTNTSVSVYIRNADIIKVSQSVSATVNCKNLNVESNATLTLGDNGTLVTLNCYGNIKVDATATINSSSTATVQNLINMLAPGAVADILVNGNFGDNNSLHLINIYPKIANLLLTYKTSIASPPTMYVNLIKPQFAGTTTVFQRDVTITSSSVALGFANASSTGYDNTTYTIDAGKTVILTTGSVALTTSAVTGPGVGGGSNNATMNINGTLSIGNNLSIKNIAGNIFNMNIGSTGTLTVAKQFNVPSGAGTVNITVNAGGNVNFTGTADSCNLNPAAVNVTMNGTWDFSNTLSTANSRGLGTASVNGKLIFPDNNFPSSGITLNTGSTVEYQGATAYNLPASPATYSNLTINNIVGNTLSAATIVNGILTVTAGMLTTDANDLTLGAAASASLEAGTVLSISGGTTNFAGRPVILKSSTTGTASIANITGTLNGASNVTLQRYVPGGKRAFRFFAHPFTNTLNLNSLTDNILVTGAPGTGFTASGTNNPSAFWYNPATGTENSTNDIGWTAFTTTDGTDVGNGWGQYKGLRVLVRGNIADGLSPVTPSAVTVDATGQLNIGTQVIPIIKGTNSGFNFIGNPFASNIDLDVTGGNVVLGSNVVSNYYVWDMTVGLKGGWDNRSFNTSYILPSFAGFIVKTTANDNITIAETAKTATAATGTLYRANGTKPSMVRLWVKGNGINWDKFELYYNSGSKLEEDKNDGVKFLNSEVNFYSRVNGSKNYSIDSRPFIKDGIIPMGFTSAAQQTYAIVASDYSLPSNVELYLKDKFLGTETKIEEGTVYTFNVTSNAASQGNERFELVQKQIAPLPIVAATAFSVKLSPNPATDMVKISFSNEDETSTQIIITDAVGKLVKTVEVGNVQSGQISISIKSLAKGTYYVTLNNGKERKTEKLIIQ